MNDVLDAHVKGLAQLLNFDISTGIATGEYPPETALPTETRLASDYGVSRSVVRSALELLKERGLVHSEQGSGTFVCKLDKDELDALLPDRCPYEFQECYACRLAIEPEIAAQLAEACPGGAMDYLGAELEHLEDFRGNDRGSVRLETVRDADFHIKLAEFSGNSFFHSIMARMRPFIMIGMNSEKNLTTAQRDIHTDRNIDEHGRIIRAILRGNSDAARWAMNEHLQNGRQRIFASGASQVAKDPNSHVPQA